MSRLPINTIIFKERLRFPSPAALAQSSIVLFSNPALGPFPSRGRYRIRHFSHYPEIRTTSPVCIFTRRVGTFVCLPDTLGVRRGRDCPVKACLSGRAEYVCGTETKRAQLGGSGSWKHMYAVHHCHRRNDETVQTQQTLDSVVCRKPLSIWALSAFSFVWF